MSALQLADAIGYGLGVLGIICLAGSFTLLCAALILSGKGR